MFFSELQDRFDICQKEKAIKHKPMEAWREDVIEQILVPILAKNFKARQKLNPEANEIFLRVYVVEEGTEFFIPTEDNASEAYAYNLEERIATHKWQKPEMTRTTLKNNEILKIFRTMCKIAPRIFYGFSAFENEEEKQVWEKRGNIVVFDLLITFTTPEYEEYLGTL